MSIKNEFLIFEVYTHTKTTQVYPLNTIQIHIFGNILPRIHAWVFANLGEYCYDNEYTRVSPHWARDPDYSIHTQP
jgi:hypothetical protein